MTVNRDRSATADATARRSVAYLLFTLHSVFRGLFVICHLIFVMILLPVNNVTYFPYLAVWNFLVQLRDDFRLVKR